MIFNPLFLNENAGSQFRAPKQTKMSNNKYLFSDIVKVVMNPVGDQKEQVKSNPLLGSNIGLALDDAQKPVQLKLKFLSDLDNEKAKLGLAEILPMEIAQLLIKDDTETSEEKAVSYISKEPLAGELQNFVNNLIGAEIIESHISDKSGLLLSLEDSKSAVNLELVQVSGKKSITDKIVVQTLVVPEKSKLLSLMGDVQNKKGLFRIDNSQVQNLNNVGEVIDVSKGLKGDAKPTLSVYSFNYGGENFESLTKSVKVGQELNHNQNLMKSQNSGKLNIQGKNVPLDKISFIPSDLKNAQQVPTGIYNDNKSQLKPLLNDLKLLKSESANIPKDFSVSKITIVKKTGETVVPDKLQINNNSSGEKLNTELKHIDFGKQINLKNIQISNSNNKLDTENSKNLKNNNKVPALDKLGLQKDFQNNISKTVQNTQTESGKTIQKGDSSIKVVHTNSNLESKSIKDAATAQQILKNINRSEPTKTPIEAANSNKAESLKNTAGQKELKNIQQSVSPKASVETANSNKTEGMKNTAGQKELKNTQQSETPKTPVQATNNNKAESLKNSAGQQELKSTQQNETPKTPVQAANNNKVESLKNIAIQQELKNVQQSDSPKANNNVSKENNVENLKSTTSQQEIKSKQQSETPKTPAQATNNNKAESLKNIAGQQELKSTQQSETSKTPVQDSNINKAESLKNTAGQQELTNTKPVNSSQNNVENNAGKVDLNKSKSTQNVSNENNLKSSDQISNNSKTNIETLTASQPKSENPEIKLSNKQSIIDNNKLNAIVPSELADNIRENVGGNEKELKNVQVPKSDNLESNKINFKSESKEPLANQPKIKEQPKLESIEKSVTVEDKSNLQAGSQIKEIQPQANKKISVKIKGGVKSVSERIDTNVKSTKETKQNETASNNSNSSKENSSSGESKNTPFGNAQFDMKVNPGNGFQQFIGENEMAAVENEIKAASTNEVERETKLKVIKSGEVLKEVTKFISKQEKGSLSFDIKPEQLGKMKITLDTIEHVVRARIEVESEQAKQLIERNLDKLHQDLAENGIQLNSLNISLSNSKQQKEDKEMMENSKNKSENDGQVGETEEEEQKKSLGYNTYEYIA